MHQKNLTAARARELLDYDPALGTFTWKVRTSNRVNVGDPAGSMLKTGYLAVCVDGVLYRSHRLAWLYVNGAWPDRDIDHVNGVRTDNRITNLRDVSRSVNQQNLRAARGETASGVLGVYKSDRESKPWRASIKVDGKDKHLGRFRTKAEASSAYLSAKRSMHEGCTI